MKQICQPLILTLVCSLVFFSCGDNDKTNVQLDPLSPPENVLLTYEDTSGDYSQWRLNISWDAVENAVGYRVRLYLNDRFEITNDIDLPPEENEVDLDVTTNAATYEFFARGEAFAYRVAAQREDGTYFVENGVRITRAPVVPDSSLDECIQLTFSALAISWEGANDPTYQDITSLRCAEMEIQSLNGIEYLTGLTSANFNQNGISDLSPLSLLAHLESLSVDENDLAELTSISQMTALHELSIVGNTGISSLEPIKEMSHLESLTIGDHPDLPHLNDLPPDLLKLTLMGELNMTGLTQFSQLEGLGILINAASADSLDAEELSGMVNLRDFYLMNVPTEDLSFMSQMEDLKTATFDNNGLTDISALFSLPGLLRVFLFENPSIPCSQIDTLATNLGEENVNFDDQCAE